ncbi:hypothetical protein D3C78_1047960 [compost metagenome]
MVIAKVIDMIIEKGRSNPQFFDAVQLIFAHGLGMLDTVACIRTRQPPLGFADSVQHIINSRVAVGMDDHLASGRMDSKYRLC